jgi:hypothetical protein
MVQSGRHALGLDERRRLFSHTEWTNLPRLNQNAGMDTQGGPRYRQEWFPGDHGMVGGSGSERRLSNPILEWVLEGAGVAGLKVNLPATLSPTPDDFKAPLSHLANKRGWSWRDGPDRTAISDVHPVAMKRARHVAEYKPKSLKLLDFAEWQALVDQELSTRIT